MGELNAERLGEHLKNVLPSGVFENIPSENLKIALDGMVEALSPKARTTTRDEQRSR